MKRSFFRKLLFGSLSILIISFIAQWGFQQLWIEQALLSRAQSQIEAVLITLEERPSSTELQQTIDKLSTSTGSLTSVINLNDIEQQTIQLATITVMSDGVEYKILRPRSAAGTIRVGFAIQGRFYASSVTDVYVPLELTIGSRSMLSNQLSMLFSSDLFQQLGVDTSTVYVISGTIVGTDEVVVQDSQEMLYNSELLNLMSQTNIVDLEQTDRWIRYQSLDEEGNPLNLVYVKEVTLNQESLLLLTVYPLGASRLITQNLYVISLISLFAALLITTLLYGWFFKRVSIPLQQVNEATKRFSQLNFEPIPITNSNDEIEDLSRNINILSTTLSTTLTELEDRNALLLNQLDQERINDQRREELMAGISHELKTPLAIIQASVEALSLGMVKKSEIKQYQQTMEQEIARANQIITNLLHLQHQESDPSITYQWVSLDEIVQVLVKQYNPLIQQRGLQLDLTTEPCQVKADPQKIELVISNLLSNAIKYSSTQSTIKMHVGESDFRICNATTLPNDTDIDSLFFPFHRADKSRSRQDGSTGLGLSIVKQILDQHEFAFQCDIKDGLFCLFIQFKPTSK